MNAGHPEDIFFFAHDDADVYDLTDRLVQPQLDLIHATAADLLVFSTTNSALRDPGRPVSILDVGSGTGTEVFHLIARLGTRLGVVAVDFSPKMNRAFRERFRQQHPESRFSQTVAIVEHDFFSAECDAAVLLAQRPDAVQGEPAGYDAVITSFMLHHYTRRQKVEAYRRFYSVLRPGGVLIHVDLFRFASNDLSQFSRDIGVRWIQQQLTDPDATHQRYFDALGGRQPELREKWLRHVGEHTLDPIEGSSGASAAEHGEGLLELLVAAGFREAGCPFRLWEAGILWARK